MAAILCIGASGTYGVGGENGGWPEYLKQSIHLAQYGTQWAGEQHEIYNLGIPGHGVDEVGSRLANEVASRRRDMQPYVLSIICVGLNDSRALGQAENNVSTPDAYQEKMKNLLELSKQLCERTIALGFVPVDERRTCPKVQPVTGQRSFFTNARAELFENCMMQAARQAGVPGLPLFSDATACGWAEKLSQDGLHPNDAGYRWIAERVFAAIHPLPGTKQ